MGIEAFMSADLTDIRDEQFPERAERFETDIECLCIPHGTREPFTVQVANLSKSGALIRVPEHSGILPGQRILLIPLQDGFVNVEEIERSRAVLTGRIVREYRTDGPRCLGIALSPYPISLFKRVIRWMSNRDV